VVTAAAHHIGHGPLWALGVVTAEQPCTGPVSGWPMLGAQGAKAGPVRACKRPFKWLALAGGQGWASQGWTTSGLAPGLPERT